VGGEGRGKQNLQVQFILSASDFDSRIEPYPVSSADFVENTPFISEIKKYGIEIEPQNPGRWHL
jgi:hypothetical protein